MTPQYPLRRNPPWMQRRPIAWRVSRRAMLVAFDRSQVGAANPYMDSSRFASEIHIQRT
jgi:hypothetical protein